MEIVASEKVIEVLLKVHNDGPAIHCKRLESGWLIAQDQALRSGYISRVYGSSNEYITRLGTHTIWKWELTERGKSTLGKILEPLKIAVPINDTDLSKAVQLKKQLGAMYFVPAISSTYDSKGDTVVQTTLKNKLGGNATYGLFDDLSEASEDEAQLLELITLLLNNSEYLLDLALRNNRVPT